MRRESHVRICERLGVKFPGPTRHRPIASTTELISQRAVADTDLQSAGHGSGVAEGAWYAHPIGGRTILAVGPGRTVSGLSFRSLFTQQTGSLYGGPCESEWDLRGQPRVSDAVS